MLVRREDGGRVQQVGGKGVYSLGACLACRLLTHHLNLSGQVHDGDAHLRIVSHALKCPTARVAAHVEQRLGLVGKHHFECLTERAVRVEVVEGKPTLLSLFGQLRQPLVDGRPRTEVPQSGGRALGQCLLQVEHAFVVHVVVEVYVHAGGRVVYQKPPRLGQREAFGLRVHKYGSYAERGLHEALHRVGRQTRLLSHFANGQAIAAVAQQVEYAKLQHQP